MTIFSNRPKAKKTNEENRALLKAFLIKELPGYTEAQIEAYLNHPAAKATITFIGTLIYTKK